MKILRKIKIADASLSEDVMKQSAMYLRESDGLLKSIRTEFEKGLKGGSFDANSVKDKANALIKLAKLISE
jgi:hypothetical protein